VVSMTLISIKFIIISLFICHLTIVIAWEQCGDFYCPNGNTCCLDNGCIPNDMGSYNATCCDYKFSDSKEISKTGCPVGYECIQNVHDSNSSYIDRHFSIISKKRSRRISMLRRGDVIDNESTNASCLANEKDAPMADDLVKVLPRYHLCRVVPPMTQLHGLKIDYSAIKLGYYSSHGTVEHSNKLTKRTIEKSNVEMLWIVIHGSGRNADDYFCSALEAVELQNQWKDVWVIAPRFFEDIDQPPKDFLYWATNNNDGDGTWRYGANSVNSGDGIDPSTSSLKGVSSYTALDQLIERLWMMQIPHLNQIVIAGHSSGGQYVNRWSLLTESWTYKNKMKVIVANPSSYIYLTPKRWVKESQTWKVPSESKLKNCPNYNQWEWGLDDGGMFNVPYRNDLFKRKRKADVIDSFRQRQVIYLSGSLDLCPGDNMEDIKCHSHGIETTCMDELQGKNRFDRSLLYLHSLVNLSSTEPGGWKNHQRHVVEGVGHDHSLMWTSQNGIDAIFGDMRSATREV